MTRPRFLNRLAIILSLAAVALATNAFPAAGSVTIGQLGGIPNAGNCDAGLDFVQLGASSGNPYVVPGAGTITSWTVEPAGDRGTLSIKIFRRLADPTRFQVVGHAGPQTRMLGGRAANTFPANIRVRPGDLLGLHTVSATPCVFKDPGALPAIFSGDLLDGEAAAFTPQEGFDLDVQAVFVPDLPPAPPMPPDTTAPTISLGGKRAQKGSKLVKVTVTVGEAATVEAAGTVKVALVGVSAAAKSKKFKLQPQSDSLAANETATLTLRLPNRASMLIGRAQRKGKKAIAKVTVMATDAAGNQRSSQRNIKLRR